MAHRRETIGPELYICVDDNHTFSADALFLGRFATLQARDIVFDLGSGCGAVAAALFSREDAPARVTAVEIDLGAAELAALTAQSPAIAGRMAVHCGDLRDLKDSFARNSADLVVMNPPFFVAGRGHLPPDPVRRTARSDTACTLADACRAAARLLRPGGRLALCQRPEHILPLCDAMRAAGIEPKRAALVAHNPEKAPFLLLCEGRKGGKSGLVWEATQITQTNP